MTKLLKHIGISIVMIIIMTVILLEMKFEIITYLIIYLLIGAILYYVLNRFNFYGLKSNIIMIIITISIFPTYLLSASIMMYETDIVYSKIRSIPKDKLIKFYDTNDINVIPQSKRRAWIGVLYREISIISENQISNIKAVGWRGNSVFGYYNLEENNYTASYH